MKTSMWKNKVRQNAGFTLIEVIVIVAILAILAGILAPMIFSQIDDAKLARAEADAKSITSAIIALRKDVGQWPNHSGAGCPETTTFLRGNGNLPSDLAAMAFSTASTVMFSDVLMQDDEGCYTPSGKYKGPYMGMINADPWGNAYIAAASNFVTGSTDPVFVLSAGPNGKIETPPSSLTPLGDDIGVRVK